MLEEGVQSRQKLFFTHAVPQSKYATETNWRDFLHLMSRVFSLPTGILLENAIMSIWELSTMSE
jgi:hypothetical protein